MSRIPVSLSAAALRIAAKAGQAGLDRVEIMGPAAVAVLDQHLATVRAEIEACRRTALETPLYAAAAAGYRAAANRPASRWDSRANGPAVEVACPDVPFVANALAPQAALPLRLLLHYANAFVEAAVTADWWPAKPDWHPVDWESMRLAAVCRLISEAEAAAEIHPDLSSSA
ncbi:MAG: DUF6401 family natural product biosynthesis protein [Streptosporangiaceae bacterium]